MKRKGMASAREAADKYMEEAKNEKKDLLIKAQAEAQAEREKILTKANAEIETMVSAAIDKMLAADGNDPLDNFLDKAEKED